MNIFIMGAPGSGKGTFSTKIKEEFKGLVGKPQKNKVTLTYSNNPHAADGTGTTVEHPAYDYTYGIDVTKVGSDTGNPTLAGVEFTLQEGKSGNYIKSDGTLTAAKDEAILTTDSNGKVTSPIQIKVIYSKFKEKE